jgi:hypothetical protein
MDTKKANKYVKAFINSLADGKVPAPSGRDCWYCLMREVAANIQTGTLHKDGSLTNQANVGHGLNGRTLGEVAGSDHILDHIEENYFVPSMLLRAIDVFPVSKVAKYWLSNVWNGNNEPEFFCDFAKKQLASSLRRYIRQQLKLAA